MFGGSVGKFNLPLSEVLLMIISDQKQFQNLRLQEEESNELNDVVDKV